LVARDHEILAQTRVATADVHPHLI
jgi:hypothetical protein